MHVTLEGLPEGAAMSGAGPRFRVLDASGGSCERGGMANEANATAGAAPRFDLNGQIALVTGAARGLGNACAIALAQAGADVVLGLREAASAPELVQTIRSLGRRVLPLQMDITKRAEIASAVAEAVKHFGRIDILVNNAGIGPPNPVEDVTEEDFDYTLAVNLKGTFFVTQEVGRVMIKQRGGRIVNLSSQAGFVGLPTESVYCMTKAAIAHLTKCVAVEWGRYGITVNAVAPTFIRTPGTVKWLKDDTFRNDLLSKIPLGRVGDPIDVAGAVVFLASPAAALITGATILIDGGFTAR
jgi:NAD(P)-dependent dehydrogenase (short-subunit alcohol dehydrogenase family)